MSGLSDPRPNTKNLFEVATASCCQIFTCPDRPCARVEKSVFVGGGITGCPDWQSAFCQLVRDEVKALRGNDDFALFNPRREDFPIHDPNASTEQIKWEWQLLRESGAVSMWFPKDSEGPISLLELGRWLCSSKPIYVGVEKGYPRETELRTMIECIRPGLPVSTDLAQHARAVAAWLLGNGYNRLQAFPDTIIDSKRIYLAGGIRNCPDWQSELARILSEIPDISVENPRRAHFTPQGLEDFKEMVEHNRQNLDRCGAIVFWFPKDMLTPVALCELGSVLTRQKPIFIGVERGYKRAIDVEIQTHLERPEVSIAGSLEQLARQVRDYYASIAR